MNRSPLPSGIKSPFSPRIRPTSAIRQSLSTSFRKSSRFSVSGKSAQTAHIVLKTPYHTAEHFGNTLPVIVTEALTFAERNIVVSFRISDCGFAWLVCGRRLLVWQYKSSSANNIQQQSQQADVITTTPQQRRIQGGQCFELTLPQSDLAHRAQLISVFMCPGNHMPSCIAVSPEGVVRYWPNISHEGISVEQTVDLQGQECDSLCPLGEKVNGCVLATTTCTVVLVQPRLTASGRHVLHCHTLRTPTGWLGGIGKRMSSLIFGPMTAEHTNETRLVRVLNVKQSEDTWHVYVVAGHLLQKWQMTATDPEQLIFASDLSRIVRDAYQCTAWESCGSDPADIDLWLLDIQVHNNSLLLLSAAVNLPVSPQVRYALVRLDSSSAAQIDEFLLLKLFGLYQEDDMGDFLSFRFLLNDNCIYVHRPRDVSIIQPDCEPDVLDFSTIGDNLLGGAVCSNTPVFFSRNHGLVAIYPTDHFASDLNRSILDASIDRSSMQIGSDVLLNMHTSNLSLYNLDPEDVNAAQKDTIGQLKAAFLFHIKNQQESCEEILSKLFPTTATSESLNRVDNILDKAVIVISSELIDDIPVGDPRWLNERAGLGSSSSMQIQHQLEDKQQALNLFFRFLQGTRLWSRLSAVTVNNSILATTHLLADHSERLIAAIHLKNLNSTNSHLLQEALDFIVEKLYEKPTTSLTKQDIFYREVTKIHRGLWALVEKCNQSTSSDTEPSSLIHIISETNNILLAVLSAVMQFRQQNTVFFSPSVSVMELPVEYLPWTVRSGEHGLYSSLQKQQSVTLGYGSRVCTDGATRANLYDQYVSLVDVMLDAKKCHVESVKNTNAQRAETLLRQYQQERHSFIQPLVIDCEWERAALLAEKYLDFTTLVEICEATNNEQRLDDYMERFKNEHFAQHMFNWYIREGKQGKLLQRCRTYVQQRSTSSCSLGQYLATHPQLKWMQYAFQGDYQKASEALELLASQEQELLMHKKTKLSFAKLCSFLANGIDVDTSFVRNINHELDLIQRQEEISDDVLTAYGYDSNCQPVLDPLTLANLYICPENQDVTEFDFQKALELSESVNDYEKRHELVLSIWIAAIVRDENKWQMQLTDIDSPIEILRETLFFKVVDLAITLGKRPGELLPAIDILLQSSDLGKLKENQNFQYLIKVAYDYFFRN